MGLLADAPTGKHFAQFHRNSDSLSESVATFLAGGIRRGDVAVVIATTELQEALVAILSENKFHLRALRESGQLELIDAGKFVAELIPNGVPEWARFRTTLAAALARVESFGRNIRIFTELGSMLWMGGNTEGAILLEEHWNALAKLHTFSLYCGYMLDTQREESYTGPLEDVGHVHTDILGTDEDDRFGVALDRASNEIFGLTLSQMAGMTNDDGVRRLPSGQRTMLWVKRNLPLSTAQLAERARRYYQESFHTIRR